MSLKTASRRPAAANRAPTGELVTIRKAGEATLPQRNDGRAKNRVAERVSLLGSLVDEAASVDRLALRKSLEARAPASVKALANDLACYASFCARAGGMMRALPANEPRIVAYLEDCENRKLKPATMERRLASLAVVHGLLCVPSPTRGGIVRDALRVFRRRVNVIQRQAGPLRFGKGVGNEPVKGFTLSVLLQACPADLPGLRDAALLSLAYDTGLRVSELVRVYCQRTRWIGDPGDPCVQDRSGGVAGGLCLDLRRYNAAGCSMASGRGDIIGTIVQADWRGADQGTRCRGAWRFASAAGVQVAVACRITTTCQA